MNSIYTMPALGVGITYSAPLIPLFESHPHLFDVIEIEPQTTWRENNQSGEKYRISEDMFNFLKQLPGRKIVHSVGVPVGGSVKPDPQQLALLNQTISKFNSPWISEHLSFNTTPEFSTGFFLPARQTSAGVKTVVSAIQNLQTALSVPLAVETGVNYLRPRKDEIPDGLFTAEVVTTSDCGLLLDLHNIFANALNGRQPVEIFLSQIPLERVWEVHVAGGIEMDNFYLDAHSGAMSDMLLSIMHDVIPHLPNIKALIFEIFPSFVDVVGLKVVHEQIEKLHDVWSNRLKPSSNLLLVNPIVLPSSSVPDNSISPDEWELTLGSLVIGQTPPSNNLSTELAGDPGVSLIRKLIKEFRASMIVNILRLTSRYLMLSLSPDVFWEILEDFWAKNPPHQFASSEAEVFADYLVVLQPQVPHLLKILEFERAVMRTLIDDKNRVIDFDFDPLPLLRALSEARLPEMVGQIGNFEIEITADGPISATGLSLEELRSVFRFH